MPITPQEARHLHEAREEDLFTKLCNSIDEILTYNIKQSNIFVDVDETRFLDSLQQVYQGKGWSVALTGNGGLQFTQKPAETVVERQTLVLEDEFIKVELVPVEEPGNDVLYGKVVWRGTMLRATLKRGLITDTQALRVGGKEYLDLVTEKPTILFGAAEPKR